MPQPLRSVLAIFAGYLTLVAIVMICTVLFVHFYHVQLGHPTPAYLTGNVVCSAVAAFAGGWLTAYIAGYRPLLHGAVLATILLAFSALSFAHPAPGQSLLYRIVITLVMPLCTLAAAATERAKH